MIGLCTGERQHIKDMYYTKHLCCKWKWPHMLWATIVVKKWSCLRRDSCQRCTFLFEICVLTLQEMGMISRICNYGRMEQVIVAKYGWWMLWSSRAGFGFFPSIWPFFHLRWNCQVGTVFQKGLLPAQAALSAPVLNGTVHCALRLWCHSCPPDCSH